MMGASTRETLEKPSDQQSDEMVGGTRGLCSPKILGDRHLG